VSTAFLVAEILRMGESLKWPNREGVGVNLMSTHEQRLLREKFLEYSMELAQRAQRRSGR
jgi:hypothetical protein